MKLKRAVSAFTLIELLVTIVMMGMLSSISIATYNGYVSNTKVSVIKKTVNDLYRFTVLYARETDTYYQDLVPSEVIDRFGVEELPFTTISYVASDIDFFYQATLPDGVVWTVGVIPRAYASDGNSSYYAAGTKKAMDYFESINEETRKNLTKAANDSVIANSLKASVVEGNFRYTEIASPWEGDIPDKDRDTVPDYRDDCPEVSGPVNNLGCPLVDSDGDGVYDKDDRCPKEAGDKYNYGCPVGDYDKDGIPDDEDKCTEAPGEIYNYGCPVKEDGDNDGVGDEFDECPKEAGLTSNKGCPDKNDIDGDGIFNKEDECPENAGNAVNYGCPIDEKENPDKDKDGVGDRFDKCPKEAGSTSNNGCPIKK